MRILVILPVILIAACSSQQPQNRTAENANGTMATSAVVPKGMRGPEPATSASALSAKKLVEQYYALITRKKYAEARALWGNGGADVGGNTAAFAKTITPYSVYEPKVGSPTEIKVADGKQYVNVAATLHVQRRDTKAQADRNGVVMLYRSVDPHDKNLDKREWKIRGVDIRVRN